MNLHAKGVRDILEGSVEDAAHFQQSFINSLSRKTL
jgi:hypothetical protein